ncbi:unnamed protein product [Clonostachys byssicola]|uniref:Uncharacterized protein n=1 Tax=Clonostachys byssicola TaxID=160290 RepID=A0A9N9UFG6_9HYPO|nr:unnamed protein product [Clonostachys byssicola]
MAASPSDAPVGDEDFPLCAVFYLLTCGSLAPPRDVATVKSPNLYTAWSNCDILSLPATTGSNLGHNPAWLSSQRSQSIAPVEAGWRWHLERDQVPFRYKKG